MKHTVRVSLILCLAALLQLFPPEVQAAPGDFLFKWGLPHLLTYPNSAGIDSAGNAYITEGYRIRVLDKNGNLVRTFGSFGQGDGQIDYPSDVAVTGNLVYVSDTGNNRIEVFDTDGKFVRKWGSYGTGNGQFNSPQGIATDSRGNVYVVDQTNARIQVFDGNGNFVRTFGSQGTQDGQFSSVFDVAVDGTGNIYALDSYFKVQVFDNQGNFLRKWTPDSSGTYWGSHIAIDSLGNVYVSMFDTNEIPTNKVLVFDGSGALLREWPLFTYGFGEQQLKVIEDLTIDSNRNVYLADTYNNRIQVFDSSGKYLRTLGGDNANGQFKGPQGAATDPSGNVYVADAENARIQIFDSRGNFLRKFGSMGFNPGQFGYPVNLTVDRSGNIYVVDHGQAMLAHHDYRIQVFDNNGKYLRSWEAVASTTDSVPGGIAVDSAGNVYVADYTYHVHVYNNAGTLIRSWGSFGSGSGQMGAIWGLALDSFGNVYVADHDNRKIQVFTGTGTFLRSWGLEGTGYDGSYNHWLAIDGAGNVYVTDIDSNGDHNVQVFDSFGKFLGNIGSSGSGNGQFHLPAGLATNLSGGTAYVVDSDDINGNSVQAYVGFGDQLPTGWAGRDVGSVGVTGHASFANGTFTVQGSGSNIWGSADAFHYVYRPLTGDGEIVARVTAVQNTNGYAKGGVMIRETLAANSVHAMVDIEATAGAEFSRRFTTGGSTTVTGATGIGAPYWVKLVRKGSSFSGYISKDGVTWTLLGTSTINMASTAYVGLIANSHNNSVLCTTTVDAVSLNGLTDTPTVSITTPANGATYTAPASINVAATATPSAGANIKQVDFFAGSTLIATEVSAPYSFTWSNATAGSYTLTARVTDTFGNTATSVPVTIAVNTSGLPAPWLTRDVGSVGLVGSAGYTNGLFTVKGAGANIYGTTDGFRFVYQPLSGDTQIVARVVSVQNTNAYAKAGVMIRQSLSGNSTHAMMDITPSSGAEFSRRSTTGGSTTATVRTGIRAPYWVKLVRSGSTFVGSISSDGVNWSRVASATISMSGTVYVGLIVNSHNNSVLCTGTFDNVSVTGGTADVTAPTVTAFTIPSTSSSLKVPITTFTATDGSGGSGVTGYLVTESSTRPTASASGWSATAPTSYSFATAGTKTLYAWAKDAAGNVSNSRSATVTVSTGALPSPWLTQDIGSVGVIGSATYANGTFTLKGSGADIWGTADAFRFVYKVMTGDGEIIARVASVQNTNSYAKGGVMMRQSLAANSMHAMMDLRPTGGAEFSRRTSAGGTTSATTRTGIAAPYWVRLVRSGGTFTGYVSSNGTTWSQVGSANIGMTSSIYVGLIVNSHSNSVLCSTIIDSVK